MPPCGIGCNRSLEESADAYPLAALAAAADPSAVQQVKNDDPVVCKRDHTSEVGTHMQPKPVCMKKSEWDIVEKHTQTELQSLRERSSFDPGMADGHRPQ